MVIMKYLALAALVYAFYRFARFVLEPDYLRCDTGSKWNWINELEERLINK